MHWVYDLLWRDSVAHTMLIYCFIVAIGVTLGKINVGGVSLGITFVLFTGIAVGHFGFTVDHQVIDFIKDFGLILFVFAIGLQVGPGFFSSFKKGGITLNMLAILVIVLGASTTLLIHLITGTSLPMLVGVMSGAVTNTPGLGAAQEALRQVALANGSKDIPEIGLGYAVAYPFGVVGIISTMFLIRKLFRIKLSTELDEFTRRLHPTEALPEKQSVVVTNPSLFNCTIGEASQKLGISFIVSRILHKGKLISANSESIIHENDVILIVARKGTMPMLIKEIGSISPVDLSAEPGKLVSRQILVTRRAVFGKTIESLKLRSRYNINITRIYRSGIELIAQPGLMLQMGDKVTVVGEEDSINMTANELGDSIKRLNEPNLVPIFIGILTGVILGSIPIILPGIPNPLKLGLAGGPLVIAILLSRYGYRLSLTAYTTPSANLMLREIGIVLFLASVGLKAGEKFIPTLMSGDGFQWMLYGAAITLIPIVIAGLLARIWLKRNFFEICGLLSGSMTDPPALAYANGLAQSEAPAIAYATVYPLVMFLRIFAAQLLILLFT